MPFFEHRHLVIIGDTNVGGNVYFERYVAWMGEARERWLLTCTEGILDLFAQGLTLFTRDLAFTYHRELRLADPVLLRLCFSPFGRTGFVIACDIVHERTGVLHAQGRQTIVCAGINRHPCRMPPALIRAVQAYAAA